MDFDETTGSEYEYNDAEEDFSSEFDTVDDIYNDSYSQDNEIEDTTTETEDTPDTTEEEEEDVDDGSGYYDEEEKDDFGDDDEEGESTEDGEQENSEPSEDSDEAETDIAIPPYLPEDLVPKKFETEEEANKFYKENYGKLIEYYTSQEFNKQFLNTFEDVLLSREQYVEELKAVRSALTGENAELMLKIYFPQILADYGKAPQLSDNEMATIVHNQLANKFGEDYMERFKKEDLLKPDSISSKILQFEQDVIRQVREHNETEWKKQQETVPQENNISVPEIAELLEKQYKEYFAESGVTEEEYGDFVQQLSNYQITTKDLHRAMYFDDYINEAFRQGIETGKKGLAAEITKANGMPLKRAVPQQDKRTNRNDDAENIYFSDDRLIANGGLIY